MDTLVETGPEFGIVVRQRIGSKSKPQHSGYRQQRKRISAEETVILHRYQMIPKELSIINAIAVGQT